MTRKYRKLLARAKDPKRRNRARIRAASRVEAEFPQTFAGLTYSVTPQMVAKRKRSKLWERLEKLRQRAWDMKRGRKKWLEIMKRTKAA